MLKGMGGSNGRNEILTETSVAHNCPPYSSA